MIDVDYGRLIPPETTVEKLDEFEKEVDQVSFKKLKTRIILDRAESK